MSRNEKILEILDSHRWEGYEFDNRVITYTLIETEIKNCFKPVEVDVTDWTDEQLNENVKNCKKLL